MDPQDGGSSLIFFILGAFIFLTVISLSERAEPNLKHIPTLGRQGYLLSYVGAFGFVLTGPSLLGTAYEKYRPGVFKVATLHRWLVVVTGTRLVEELRKVPEDELSLVGVANEADTPLYHPGHSHSIGSEDIGALTRHITQNLPFLIPEIREEIVTFFNTAVKTAEGSNTGWIESNPVDLVVGLTTGANNRLFFGIPMCRDADYKTLSTLVAHDAFKFQFSFVSNLFPNFKSSIYRLFSSSHRHRRGLRKLFLAMLHGRKYPRDLREHASRDVLSWILNDDSKKASVDRIAMNLFDLNQTATQTLLTSFLHVLYNLSANPKFASPMRKEIESIVSREGWTKPALDKMHKVDSFVKESLRLNGVSSLAMISKALKDFTLSDGTHIPKGTVLAAATRARHLDSSLYGSSSGTFDALRFSKLQEEQHQAFENDDSPISMSPGGSLGTRFQLISASTDYLAWGYGRHACPGRFYASVVMKLMLAHIVLNYDVRFEDGLRPEDVVFGPRRLPHLEVKMLLRKR